MDVRSLAYRTDLALLQLGGSEVVDHHTHRVVRSPHNPGFYWGNFLLLAEPPADGSGQHWAEIFRQAFPDAEHCAIGVDGTQDAATDLAPLAEAGLEIETSTVMTASDVRPPPRPHPEAVLRPLHGDDEWAQAVALAVAEETDHQVDFATALHFTNRSLVERGEAQWFGAFLDDRLCSVLGLVRAGDGLARFQQVKTHPDARGQGLAGSLVHAASRYGFDELGARTLVMVADPEYLAIRIYRSVGFTASETQLAALRPPSKADRS